MHKYRILVFLAFISIVSFSCRENESHSKTFYDNNRYSDSSSAKSQESSHQSAYIGDTLSLKDTTVYESDIVEKDTIVINEIDTCEIHIKIFPNKFVIKTQHANYGDSDAELIIKYKGRTLHYVIGRREFIAFNNDIVKKLLVDFGFTKMAKNGWTFYATYCVPDTDYCIQFECLISYNGKMKITIDQSFESL